MKTLLTQLCRAMLIIAGAMTPCVAILAQDRDAPPVPTGECRPMAAADGGAANNTPPGAEPTTLTGFWELTLWPSEEPSAAPVSVGTLLLEPHPEYPGSVRGSLRRSQDGHDLRAWVAGDLTDNVFLLDESEDGLAMSAVWEGDGSAAACGPGIRGFRRTVESSPSAGQRWYFQLRRSTQLR